MLCCLQGERKLGLRALLLLEGHCLLDQLPHRPALELGRLEDALEDGLPGRLAEGRVAGLHDLQGVAFHVAGRVHDELHLDPPGDSGARARPAGGATAVAVRPDVQLRTPG